MNGSHLQDAEEDERQAKRPASRLYTPSVQSTTTTLALSDRADYSDEVASNSEKYSASASLALDLKAVLARDAHSNAQASSYQRPSGLFMDACSTDLLFLIDTTGSMSPYIAAVKEQVERIIKSIQKTFLNEADVRIAIVSYKDHIDYPNVQVQDFTSHVDVVLAFLKKLDARGGDDPPEDVLGGIRQALDTTWTYQTRCIIHIADAPPHGKEFSMYNNRRDTYPNLGEEPHGLIYEDLLREMIGMQINYALLRINGDTDRMALKFMEMYSDASAKCRLHELNKYYEKPQVLRMPSRFASKKNKSQTGENVYGQLLFEEMKLGVDYSQLQHLVLHIVTDSASSTAVRLSAKNKKSAFDAHGPKLAIIDEDQPTDDTVELDTTKPRWGKVDWCDENLTLAGFSSTANVFKAGTLDRMMESDKNIGTDIMRLTIRKRLRPFAQGATRDAFYAETEASNHRFVIKSASDNKTRLSYAAEAMLSQALCRAFAVEFNASLPEERPIDFIASTCLRPERLQEKDADDSCVSLEPYIEGTYTKYNNNSGWVNLMDDHFNQVAQAFSHFTFERSHGRFLVCDLQGVPYLLTDPAVHTLHPERFKLSESNLGLEGFKFFFATHQCNETCKKLGLLSNRDNFQVTEKQKFKATTKWPQLTHIPCCSNKLCGKIVSPAERKRTSRFPNHVWCSACWSQLEAITAKQTCEASEPHHEFKVSKFFFESQGRSVPLECRQHREDYDLLEIPAEAPIKEVVVEEALTAKAPTAQAPIAETKDRNWWQRWKSAMRPTSLLCHKS